MKQFCFILERVADELDKDLRLLRSIMEGIFLETLCHFNLILTQIFSLECVMCK